jgi:hypothetical protein
MIPALAAAEKSSKSAADELSFGDGIAGSPGKNISAVVVFFAAKAVIL